MSYQSETLKLNMIGLEQKTAWCPVTKIIISLKASRKLGGRDNLLGLYF